MRPAPARDPPRRLRPTPPAYPPGTEPRSDCDTRSSYGSLLALLPLLLGRVAAVRGCVLRLVAAARERSGQLVDQVLQHQRVLHQLDAVALLEIFVAAAGGDADVLTAEQTGGHDGGVAVLRNAVIGRIDPHAHHGLVDLLVEADRV